MSRIGTLVMGTFFRWFPHRATTGLRAVGNPDENSPVLVTCNYTLTVARLLRAVGERDLWLLVAPSDGINVWCSACGGVFTAHQVISAVKTSMLTEKVTHRELILPPLSAPGVDRKIIREETGFHCRFGPVRASDIPGYLDSGKEKTESMKRVRLGLKHRLDMLVSMNFIIWAPIAVIFAILRPQSLLHFSALFWGLALFLYLLFPLIPGRTGWHKSLVPMAIVSAGYLAAGFFARGDLLAYRGWIVGGILLCAAISFDAAGIVAPMPSDAEAFVQKLGFKRIGSLFNEKSIGSIALDVDKCIGCHTCAEICPVGVHEADKDNRKTSIKRPGACFSCGACVKQCPCDALSLNPNCS